MATARALTATPRRGKVYGSPASGLPGASLWQRRRAQAATAGVGRGGECERGSPRPWAARAAATAAARKDLKPFLCGGRGGGGAADRKACM